jgi:ubiquinol-cytochrome c reductase cytochrome c1 subunit
VGAAGRAPPLFEDKQEHGHEVKVFKGWEQITPGTMTPQEYDQAMGDLVATTCSGWASLPRTPACASVCGCCCSWRVLHRHCLALNAAFWKDVK